MPRALKGTACPISQYRRTGQADRLPEVVGGGSFVATDNADGRPGRGLHEQANPRHRLRVEHDAHTLLIHLSDEDGAGWTTVAVDRTTRQWAVAQVTRQGDTARAAFDALYGGARGH